MFNRDIDENLSYTEDSYDYELKNPLDLLAYVLSSFVLAPYRFFTEFSTKVVFLGRENIRKTVLLALIINTVIVAWNLGTNIFVKHEINIIDSYDSLVTMGLSFILTLVLYFVICLTDPVIFTYQINYDEDVEIKEDVEPKNVKHNNTIETIKQNAQSKIESSKSIAEDGGIYDEIDLDFNEPIPLDERSPNDLALDFDDLVSDEITNPPLEHNLDLSSLNFVEEEEKPMEINKQELESLLGDISLNPSTEQIDATEDIAKNQIDLDSLSDFNFDEYM